MNIKYTDKHNFNKNELEELLQEVEKIERDYDKISG